MAQTGGFEGHFELEVHDGVIKLPQEFVDLGLNGKILLVGAGSHVGIWLQETYDAMRIATDDAIGDALAEIAQEAGTVEVPATTETLETLGALEAPSSSALTDSGFGFDFASFDLAAELAAQVDSLMGEDHVTFEPEKPALPVIRHYPGDIDEYRINASDWDKIVVAFKADLEQQLASIGFMGDYVRSIRQQALATCNAWIREDGDAVIDSVQMNTLVTGGYAVKELAE